MVDDGVLDVSVLPQQHEALSFDTLWAGTRGGTGSGKTVAWCYWMWSRVEDYPHASHFVVGADYEQLRRGFFQSYVGALERAGWEEGVDYRYRESPSPMVIHLHTGARLRSLSAKLAERIRSVEFQSLLLEEPQTWQNGEEIYGILNGRLRHSERSARRYGSTLECRGRLSFNPPTMGSWLYHVIERIWPSEGYPCLRMSVRDNYLMLDVAKYVRGIELSRDPSRWPSEIDGHWATSGGSVYLGFDRTEMTEDPPAPLPPIAWRENARVCWALDFNVGWMASVVGQWYQQQIVVKGAIPPTPFTTVLQQIKGPEVDGWQSHILYLHDELFLADCGIPDVLAEFLRRHGERARRWGVTLYGDPAGGGRSQQLSAQSSARTNWQMLVQGLQAVGIDVEFRVPNAAPSVLDRVNMTRAQFKTGAGHGFVINAHNCANTCDDFELVNWKKTTTGAVLNDIDKSDGKRTHLSDAAGYMIWVERMIAERKPVDFKNVMGR